jgi:uridylate kinase
MAKVNLKYKRVLLKLSGESLMGQDCFGYNKASVDKIVTEIKSLHTLGVEIAIVVGGGNICRGKALTQHGIDQAPADYMGMMATIMNGLYLKEVLEARQIESRVMTALAVNEVAEPFIRLKAIKHLSINRVVILVGGTGNPFSTTDTAAALKAQELKCNVIIKATKVDGVYDKDPKKFTNAQHYENLNYNDAIKQNLEVMDMTAFIMCKNSGIPIVVCNVLGINNLKNIALGKNIGTLVNNKITVETER